MARRKKLNPIFGGSAIPERRGMVEQGPAAKHWLKHPSLCSLPNSPAMSPCPPLTSPAMLCENIGKPLKPPSCKKVKVKVACSFKEPPVPMLKQFDDQNIEHFWCKYCQILLRDEEQVADHIQGRKHAKHKRLTPFEYPDNGIDPAPAPRAAGRQAQ